MRRASLLLSSLLLCCLAGCTGPRPSSNTPPRDDTDARTFAGTIISLRFTTSTMLISKDEKVKGGVAIPNIVTVRYDAQTKFLLDHQPTTLDKLDRYMPVRVQGHMRDGQLFADTASFSSQLPQGAAPSQVDPGPAPAKSTPAP